MKEAKWDIIGIYSQEQDNIGKAYRATQQHFAIAWSVICFPDTFQDEYRISRI